MKRWRIKLYDGHEHTAVFHAIRKGSLSRPSHCSQCKQGGRIHAHHEDYNKPLDVIWLCISCHKRVHDEDEAAYFKAVEPWIWDEDTKIVYSSLYLFRVWRTYTWLPVPEPPVDDIPEVKHRRPLTGPCLTNRPYRDIKKRPIGDLFRSVAA